jgi:hypothetical protein
MERLFQISSERFCAGVVVREGRVVECAPILRRHLLGLDGRRFAAVCARKGWRYVEVARPAGEPPAPG